MKNIIEKLESLEKILLLQKEVLTIEELSLYTGYTIDYIYKMVHQNIIPYSKPNNKKLFFEKKKIVAWLTSNSNTADYILEQRAQAFISKKSFK